MPLPVTRVRQAALVQVQPQAGEHVHVQVPGILKALYVTDGQYVPKDFVLAEFTNLEVENELDETQAKLDAKIAEVNALTGKLNEPGLDPSDVGKMQKQRSDALGERDRLRVKRDDYLKMTEDLILKAPLRPGHEPRKRTKSASNGTRKKRSPSAPSGNRNSYGYSRRSPRPIIACSRTTARKNSAAART